MMPRLPDDEEDSLMHRLDESRETLMHSGAVVKSTMSSTWDGFTNFALNDNVLEVAIGLVYIAPLPNHRVGHERCL